MQNLTREQIQSLTTSELWAILRSTNLTSERFCNELKWAKAELRRRGYTTADVMSASVEQQLEATMVIAATQAVELTTKEVADMCEAHLAAHPDNDFSQTCHEVACLLSVNTQWVQDSWTEHYAHED